nr:hypothetical protein [uncultured Flavobacterium sp.]
MTTTTFNQQGKKVKVSIPSKIEEMEEALRNINFYVGGLTDEAIEYYYNKMVIDGKI